MSLQGDTIRGGTLNSPIQTFRSQIQDPARQHAVRVRGKVEGGIRSYFQSHDFLEVRTPLLAPCPGMEVHIRPFAVTDWKKNRRYALPTSPEFGMKKLLAGGMERIFQICPAFRDEPVSTTHLPEFTMLEWYQVSQGPHSGFEWVMKQTEELVQSIALAFDGQLVRNYQGKQVDLRGPWPKYRINDLFKKWIGIDLLSHQSSSSLAAVCESRGLPISPEDTWDDLYFKLWLNFIEPELDDGRPCFVTDYPPSQSALARVETSPIDGAPWALRFEVYMAGFELANAFNELLDPYAQEKRFEKDMELRTELYSDDFPKTPVDQAFLRALREGMPECGGIALGVDRLVMFFADVADIRLTQWLPVTSEDS